MRSPDGRRYGRRAVLGTALGLAALGATGCELFDRSPDPPPPPDPLEPLRAQARMLVERYDLVMATQPVLAARLAPLRDDHLAHVAELDKIISTPASSTVPSAGASAPPADPGSAVTALRAAEEAAQLDAVAACLAAPAARAGLVGSIAACRATHVVVLA